MAAPLPTNMIRVQPRSIRKYLSLKHHLSVVSRDFYSLYKFKCTTKLNKYNFQEIVMRSHHLLDQSRLIETRGLLYLIRSWTDLPLPWRPGLECSRLGWQSDTEFRSVAVSTQEDHGFTSWPFCVEFTGSSWFFLHLLWFPSKDKDKTCISGSMLTLNCSLCELKGEMFLLAQHITNSKNKINM